MDQNHRGSKPIGKPSDRSRRRPGRPALGRRFSAWAAGAMTCVGEVLPCAVDTVAWAGDDRVCLADLVFRGADNAVHAAVPGSGAERCSARERRLCSRRGALSAHQQHLGAHRRGGRTRRQRGHAAVVLASRARAARSLHSRSWRTCRRARGPLGASACGLSRSRPDRNGRVLPRPNFASPHFASRLPEASVRPEARAPGRPSGCVSGAWSVVDRHSSRLRAASRHP